MSAPHPQNRIIVAPERFKSQGEKTVFLSGCIEQGPITWQVKLSNALASLPITIINPHRSDWDPTWVEHISNLPFREQVMWEQEMMEAADVIAIYFSPDSKAPITLLEFGLFAKSGKVVVACPNGYWKRGHVQVVCQLHEIELLESLEELQRAVEQKLEADR
jgi:hypothetical protein